MRKVIFCCVFISAACVVRAQEQKIVAADSSTNEISLDEVTLAATRFSVSQKNIPQQVHSISNKRIAALNQQTTAELLTHTGEVLVQKSQLGGGSPIIRGFEANKILLVVDGVRMNNAIYRGGHLQNIITVDQAMLDKAEILFGPSSVMYGTDALGGVVSFYTKKPVLSAGKIAVTGNAFARYASAYNEKTGHADVNIGGKKLASLTSFTFSDFGDMKQGSNYFSNYPNWGKRLFYVDRIGDRDSMIANANPDKQVQTGYKQYDFLQKFLFKTGTAEQVLNFQYSTSSDIYRYDRLTEINAAGVAKSAQWYYGPQKRLMAAWTVNLSQSRIYDKAQITAAYQQIEESRHNRNFKSSKLNHRIEKLDIVSLNADFRKMIGKLDMGYGAEITYNKVNSAAYAENTATGEKSSLDTRYPDGGSNTQSYALYANGICKVTDRLIASGGLRFSRNRLYSKFIDKTFFPFPYNDIEQVSTAVTGSAGIVYLPGNDWKIGMLVSTGFRTPNVDDMTKVFESGGGTLVVPNPNIKPEHTVNYEFSISKTIQQKFQAGFVAWYTQYHNVLGTDFSTFNGASAVVYNGTMSNVITTVNKNAAYLWGLNGNAAVNFDRHFSFAGTVSYTYGRIKEEPKNYPLDHIAPLFGKASFNAAFGKFRGEFFVLYNGAKDSASYNLRGEDNQVYSADAVRGYTPSWTTFNLRASYDINSFATLQLAVENIADKYYRVFASGLSAPGRNLVMTVRCKF